MAGGVNLKTKKRKASASVLIVLIVAILLILSVTFAAIFRQSISVSGTFQASNFSAQSVVKFEGLSDTRMEPYKTSYGGVRASVDPNADNYIGKLRASVQYQGAGVGLIRVRLVEEWSVTKNGVRTVQPYQINIPYVVSDAYTASNNANQSAWYDNRLNDYCFYYATPVYSAGTSTIDLIEGVDATGIDLGVLPIDTEINILFETDAVQVNRYPQYWGLDRLPWTGSSAAVNTGVTPSDDTSLPADA